MSKKLAYAYESGYQDGLRCAEDENAKLREERDMYRDLVGCMVHPDIPDQLHAENAKLRELVRDWRELAVIGANSSTDWNRVQADLERRMRELGVEVNE